MSFVLILFWKLVCCLEINSRTKIIGENKTIECLWMKNKKNFLDVKNISIKCSNTNVKWYNDRNIYYFFQSSIFKVLKDKKKLQKIAKNLIHNYNS